MGAVSVFTSEELPSPTLVQIFSFCRDVADSWFVLERACRFCLWFISVVVIWRHISLWVQDDVSCCFDNQMAWFNRILHGSASHQCASALASFAMLQAIKGWFRVCCVQRGFAETVSQSSFGVWWCKKVWYIGCTVGGTPRQYFRIVTNNIFFSF